MLAEAVVADSYALAVQVLIQVVMVLVVVLVMQAQQTGVQEVAVVSKILEVKVAQVW
jgi:hypothetical protein